MTHSSAKALADELSAPNTQLGEIKRLGKAIRRDHALALDLWALGQLKARLLATLIFDRNQLTQAVLDKLAQDLLIHTLDERNQIADWLLANQLMKSRRTVDLLGSWQDVPSPVLRRLFWYHQARLRWTGQPPPGNSGQLLDTIERSITAAPPEVQWAMNFCAGWIGVHEADFRERCIALGESTGLYRDEPVRKNCTPSFLPAFIRIEVAKREQ